jgi:hypothetical protein
MIVKLPKLPADPLIDDVGRGGSGRHMVSRLFATIVSEEGKALGESESVTSSAGFGNVLYVDPRDVYLHSSQAKINR